MDEAQHVFNKRQIASSPSLFFYVRIAQPHSQNSRSQSLYLGFFALTKSQFERKFICTDVPVIAGQRSSDLVDLTGFAWPGIRERSSLPVIFIIRRALIVQIWPGMANWRLWRRWRAWQAQGWAGGRQGGEEGWWVVRRMVGLSECLEWTVKGIRLAVNLIPLHSVRESWKCWRSRKKVRALILELDKNKPRLFVLRLLPGMCMKVCCLGGNGCCQPCLLIMLVIISKKLCLLHLGLNVQCCVDRVQSQLIFPVSVTFLRYTQVVGRHLRWMPGIKSVLTPNTVGLRPVSCMWFNFNTISLPTCQIQRLGQWP